MATLPLALAGVAAEFGVIMLDYQKQAWAARVAAGRDGEDDLLAAIREGAVLRVRPKAMTVATIVAGLLPLFWGAVQAARSCSALRLR